MRLTRDYYFYYYYYERARAKQQQINNNIKTMLDSMISLTATPINKPQAALLPDK